MEKVKLHRCSFMFLKYDGHTCWTVQQALDDQGIEYEIVKPPLLPRSRRKDVIRLTNQAMVPVIEFADGTAYRADGKDMAAEIEAGRLFDHKGDVPAAA